MFPETFLGDYFHMIELSQMFGCFLKFHATIGTLEYRKQCDKQFTQLYSIKTVAVVIRKME